MVTGWEAPPANRAMGPWELRVCVQGKHPPPSILPGRILREDTDNTSGPRAAQGHGQGKAEA